MLLNNIRLSKKSSRFFKRHLSVKTAITFLSKIGHLLKERYLMFSKYYPSLATTFSHLSGSIRIPRRKNASSFKAIHESTQFFVSSYSMMWSVAQTGHALSIETGSNQKEQCLVNTAGGVKLPNWVFPNRFWPALQHVDEHYHTEE